MPNLSIRILTGVELQADFTLKLDSWFRHNGRQIFVDEINIWKEPDGTINAFAFRKGVNVLVAGSRASSTEFGLHGNGINREELTTILCKWYEDLTVEQVNQIDSFYPGFAEFYMPRI